MSPAKVSVRTVLGAVSVVGVALLVVAGIWMVGSPAEARKERADALRIERLSELHYQLDNYVQEHRELPRSLSELENGFEFSARNDPREDPITGEDFDYRKLEERRYEACAVFAAASEEGEEGVVHHFAGPFDTSHPAGRHCFVREARPPDPPSRR